jgi:hypothetical protein
MLAQSANMLPRTPLYRWLAVLAVIIVVFFYHPDLSGSSLSGYTKAAGSKFARPEIAIDTGSWVQEVLGNNSIGPHISYAARTLRYIPGAKERLLLTEVDQELIPENFLDVTIDATSSLPVGETIGVHVKRPSRPSDVDASALIFGVSTTLERFNDDKLGPMKEFTRWLTDGKGNSNGAGLVIALLNVTDADRDAAGQRMADVGINATIIAANPTLDMPGRYIDLVRMMYTHPTASQRKFFTLIDDDTFFPYMSELIRELSTYNHTLPYYIGTFTERVDWMILNHAPMAYGGGGVFLTAPVAKAVAEANCIEKREDGKYVLDASQGDRLLYNCIHERTDITLTYNPRFNQMDQFGDPSGFYENGHQPLSVHHFKSWHSSPVAKIHQVADACGEDCVLQRFKFKDNFIVSNGFSVAHYPQGIDFDLAQTENTFTSTDDVANVAFSYRFGEMRRTLNRTGKKSQWMMLDAKTESDGRVKQVYLKRRTDDRWVKEEKDRPERDSIVVLTWIP